MVLPALEQALHSVWDEAYNWACHIKNRRPHVALHAIMPYEALYNAQPSIMYLGPFDTECDAHRHKEKHASVS